MIKSPGYGNRLLNDSKERQAVYIEEKWSGATVPDGSLQGRYHHKKHNLD